MEKSKLDEILRKHAAWLANKEDGEEANLREADLRWANLQGADLDYSCLPLWCGGSRFTCDALFVRQLFAHISTLTVVDADDSLKAALAAIRPEAEKSHRAEDLGLLG